MDFELKWAIIAAYAKTEAGLAGVLEAAPLAEYPDILLLGIAQKTVGSRALDCIYSWLSSDAAVALLPGWHHQHPTEVTALFELCVGDPRGHTGRDAVAAFGVCLVANLTQRERLHDIGPVLRSVILATEAVPATGLVGRALCEQLVVAGYCRVLSEEVVVLGGRYGSVPLVDILDRLSLLGAVRLVDASAQVYDVDGDMLPDKVQVMLDTYYPLPDQIQHQAQQRLCQRLGRSPLQQALLNWVDRELCFVRENGRYRWVAFGTPNTENPFVAAFQTRMAMAVKPSEQRHVIGKSQKKQQRDKPKSVSEAAANTLVLGDIWVRTDTALPEVVRATTESMLDRIQNSRETLAAFTAFIQNKKFPKADGTHVLVAQSVVETFVSLRISIVAPESFLMHVKCHVYCEAIFTYYPEAKLPAYEALQAQLLQAFSQLDGTWVMKVLVQLPKGTLVRLFDWMRYQVDTGVGSQQALCKRVLSDVAARVDRAEYETVRLAYK